MFELISLRKTHTEARQSLIIVVFSQSTEPARSSNMVCLAVRVVKETTDKLLLNVAGQRQCPWFGKPYQLFGRILRVHQRSLHNDTLENPILRGKLQ